MSIQIYPNGSEDNLNKKSYEIDNKSVNDNLSESNENNSDGVNNFLFGILACFIH